MCVDFGYQSCSDSTKSAFFVTFRRLIPPIPPCDLDRFEWTICNGHQHNSCNLVFCLLILAFHNPTSSHATAVLIDRCRTDGCADCIDGGGSECARRTVPHWNGRCECGPRV